MKLSIRVDLGDGPYTVTTNLFTIVAWERKYKSKSSDLAKGIGMEDLAFLAYEASKQNKIVVPAVFDEFIKKVQDIGVEEAEEARPTVEAPSDGN